jgi:ribosomal protein S18 acetylase RimI-like enzyme
VRAEDRLTARAAGSAVPIRSARPSDLERIVSLHVSLWRATYRDLAPADAYRRLDEAARRPRCVEALEGGSILVATDGDGIIGFVQVGPPSEAVFDGRGEIKHLYVDAAWARRGVGRRLLTEGRRLLRERGYPRAALGVVVGNAAAIRFYEAAGGCVVGRYRDPGPIWRSDNIVFAWDGDVSTDADG